MRLGNNHTSFFCCLLLTSSLALAGNTKVPDWVRTAAATPLPAVTPYTPAVVLSEEEILTVDGQGRTTRLTRQVVKLLKTKARAEWGIYREDYNKDSKVEFLHSWTIGPDNKEYELKDKDVVERGIYEGHDLYSDVSYKEATAIMAEPGAVVAFESMKHEAPYMNADVMFLQVTVPVVHRRITLNLPAGWEFNSGWYHMHEIKPVQVGPNSWQWDMGPIDAIDFDRQPLHPGYEAIAGRMMLTWFGGAVHAQAGNWENAGLWVESITAGRFEATPAISTAAQALVSGKTSFMSRVSAITTFMQDEVRYFVVQLGIGGWQPHFANDIYQHRYGDCKDKVTLLIAMLNSVGIHAHYVIVNTERGYITPSIAAASGNHAIAAIELPSDVHESSLLSVVQTKSGKRLLIFDPTDTYLPVGQLPTYLQGSYGLYVDGANSELIQLPLLKANDNAVHYTGRFTLDSDGKLIGQLVETRSGGLAQQRRALFLDGTAKEQRDEGESFLARYFSSFSLNNVSAENVHERSRPLIVKYDLTAPNYAKSSGPILLVRPRVAGSDAEPLDVQQQRRFPVEFASLYSHSEDYTITVPAGFKVEELPEPVDMDSEFASYKSKTELQGNELHYQREFSVKSLEIPTDKYGDFRKFESRVANDENAPAMLLRAN